MGAASSKAEDALDLSADVGCAAARTKLEKKSKELGKDISRATNFVLGGPPLLELVLVGGPGHDDVQLGRLCRHDLQSINRPGITTQNRVPPQTPFLIWHLRSKRLAVQDELRARALVDGYGLHALDHLHLARGRVDDVNTRHDRIEDESTPARLKKRQPGGAVLF